MKFEKINVMAIVWNVDDWNCHIKKRTKMTHYIPGCCKSRNIYYKNPYVKKTNYTASDV